MFLVDVLQLYPIDVTTIIRVNISLVYFPYKIISKITYPSVLCNIDNVIRFHSKK